MGAPLAKGHGKKRKIFVSRKLSLCVRARQKPIEVYPRQLLALSMRRAKYATPVLKVAFHPIRT